MRGLPNLGLLLWAIAVLVPIAATDAEETRSPRVDGILKAIRDPESDRLLIAAHRGGYETDRADNAPENSVANILVATKKGFDLYETDLQRTRDGYFVIVHDATLDRETDGKGAAKDLTLAELRGLQKRFRDGTLSEHRVATLEEFLVAGKASTVFKIDLKPGVIDHLDAIARIVEAHGMLEQAIFRIPWREADRVEKLFAKGTPRVALLFMVSDKAAVEEAIERFSPETIQINIPKDGLLQPRHEAAIRTAVKAGLCVETHSYGDPKLWPRLRKLGVRMLHSHERPSELVAFREARRPR